MPLRILITTICDREKIFTLELLVTTAFYHTSYLGDLTESPSIISAIVKEILKLLKLVPLATMNNNVVHARWWSNTLHFSGSQSFANHLSKTLYWSLGATKMATMISKPQQFRLLYRFFWEYLTPLVYASYINAEHELQEELFVVYYRMKNTIWIFQRMRNSLWCEILCAGACILSEGGHFEQFFIMWIVLSLFC